MISNGRMFAYDRFTERAVAAGLDEVTVSIHGHTAELHDHLVGIPGAFAQSLRGIRNLRRAGRVVSIDVVVTRPNVRHLEELMQLFLAQGIGEFDLLHLVPFGRAFAEHREELFYDPAEERPRLAAALRLAAIPGVHLWTNRWPAPLLEGAEHLIQDPHKILDEVRGTREGLTAFLETGVAPWCRGERCAHCFLAPFCDALAAARAAHAAGTCALLLHDARAAPALGPGARDAIARHAGAAWRVRAADAEAAAAALRDLPRGGTAPLELDLDAPGAIPADLAARTRRVVVRGDAGLAAARALPGAVLEVPLSRATGALARRAASAAPGRVVVTLPGRERLSDLVALDPSPAELSGAAADVRTEGLAPCLAAGSEPCRDLLDVATLRPDGVIDLLPWAEAWVREGFRTRSLRCGACADASRCPGAHVNYVRAHGFGWMRPRANGDG